MSYNIGAVIIVVFRPDYKLCSCSRLEKSFEIPVAIFHLPALLVSTVNKFSTCVFPSFNPFPVTLTFFASPTSLSPTVILNGELTMCCPILFTDTTCWPISLGVNDIPATHDRMVVKSGRRVGARQSI